MYLYMYLYMQLKTVNLCTMQHLTSSSMGCTYMYLSKVGKNHIQHVHCTR